VRQQLDVGSGPEGKRYASRDVYSPGNRRVGQWAALQLTDFDGAIGHEGTNGENATRINPKQNGKARSSEQPSGDRVFLHGSFKAAVEGEMPKEPANVDGVILKPALLAVRTSKGPKSAHWLEL
jgi:hypothetical protein